MANTWDDHRGAVERLVYCKIPWQADAEDVLQEIWLCSWQNRAQLTDIEKQKAWLIGIARHKIADYYRKMAKAPALLPEDWDASTPADSFVDETLEILPARHSDLLRRTYLCGYTLREIATEAGVPLGTVKSRLYAARAAFRQEYEKGEKTMKKQFAKTMPAYRITASALPPFSVDCEELGAWFFRAREGETCDWAIYDLPGIGGREVSQAANLVHVRYTGKTIVHGVEGLAFEAEDTYTDEDLTIRRWFAVQKTDTHVRWLAESHEADGTKKISTFLDDDFLRNWGSGTENVGDLIHRPAESLDGRFQIHICGKIHETMRLRAFGKQDERRFHDRYLDAGGRTILFSEFARPEALTERGYTVDERAETVKYQGLTYVHWYDCIQDFVL